MRSVADLLRAEERLALATVTPGERVALAVALGARDVDLLVVDPECLSPVTWEALRREGIVVSIRRGDAEDPLAGAVRLTGPGQVILDIIVGRSAWQAQLLERASPSEIEGVSVPVATVADLVLLKLYAGGPQDAWDVEQLLAGPGRTALVAEVDAALGALPEDSRRIWARIVGPR